VNLCFLHARNECYLLVYVGSESTWPGFKSSCHCW